MLFSKDDEVVSTRCPRTYSATCYLDVFRFYMVLLPFSIRVQINSRKSKMALAGDHPKFETHLPMPCVSGATCFKQSTRRLKLRALHGFWQVPIDVVLYSRFDALTLRTEFQGRTRVHIDSVKTSCTYNADKSMRRDYNMYECMITQQQTCN